MRSTLLSVALLLIGATLFAQPSGLENHPDWGSRTETYNKEWPSPPAAVSIDPAGDTTLIHEVTETVRATARFGRAGLYLVVIEMLFGWEDGALAVYEARRDEVRAAAHAQRCQFTEGTPRDSVLADATASCSDGTATTISLSRIAKAGQTLARYAEEMSYGERATPQRLRTR